MFECTLIARVVALEVFTSAIVSKDLPESLFGTK